MPRGRKGANRGNPPDAKRSQLRKEGSWLTDLASFPPLHEGIGEQTSAREHRIGREEQAMQTIFLDRDGVINRNRERGDYVKSWEEFQFLPGAVPPMPGSRRRVFGCWSSPTRHASAKGSYPGQRCKRSMHGWYRRLHRLGNRSR